MESHSRTTHPPPRRQRCDAGLSVVASAAVHGEKSAADGRGLRRVWANRASSPTKDREKLPTIFDICSRIPLPSPGPEVPTYRCLLKRAHTNGLRQFL